MMMYIINKNKNKTYYPSSSSRNILLLLLLMMMMTMTMMMMENSAFVFAQAAPPPNRRSERFLKGRYYTADLSALPPSDINERQRHHRHLHDHNWATAYSAELKELPSTRQRGLVDDSSSNMGTVTLAHLVHRRFLSDIQVNNTLLTWDLFGLPMNCIDCKIGIFNTNECTKESIVSSMYLYNNTWYDFNLINPWTNVTFDSDSDGHSIGNHTFDHQLNETNFVGNVAVLGDSYGNPIGCGIFSKASDDKDEDEKDDKDDSSVATTKATTLSSIVVLGLLMATMIGF